MPGSIGVWSPTSRNGASWLRSPIAWPVCWRQYGSRSLLLEVAHHGAVDVGAGDARPERVERDLLRRDRVVEEPAHLVASAGR